MLYFALTTRGLEEISYNEIKRELTGVKIKEISYRKIVFEFSGDILELKKLRTVEDVFLLIKNIGEIGTTLFAQDLVLLLSHLDYFNYVSIINKLREVDCFSISASVVGKHDFTIDDLKNEVYKKLQEKLNIIPNDENHNVFDIRIFIEYSSCYVGVRVFDKPLHRREYKTSSTPGSLQGNIAYSMALLARIQQKDTVLDPFCGSGTILLESAYFNPHNLIGFDSNPEAILAAQKNSEKVGKNIDYLQEDFLHQVIEPNSVDKIITNPPFGKQVKVNTPNFVKRYVDKINDILRPGGIFVIITKDYSTLLSHVHNHPNLCTDRFIDINLNGEFVYIIRGMKL